MLKQIHSNRCSKYWNNKLTRSCRPRTSRWRWSTGPDRFWWTERIGCWTPGRQRSTQRQWKVISERVRRQIKWRRPIVQPQRHPSWLQGRLMIRSGGWRTTAGRAFDRASAVFSSGQDLRVSANWKWRFELWRVMILTRLIPKCTMIAMIAFSFGIFSTTATATIYSVCVCHLTFINNKKSF